ncbi:MAG: imidazoleglycerol-phosphate dehydratase HisB [Eubacterium sp.]|jgi:imidazoleglycerol-phosphate dehydratase|uniref:imidazoleglycerol-phosphate dehydratase HisB n=1 Tax=Eubacterium sp. F2 TaxID=3381348 RepID=UPI0039082135|nr:imidazoleglycerol-phosphate dehydratase HisB [Eubacterium sp.]MCI2196724.1 imidazoleglycerol-phosphate dehydratase HisB [Eubacterium sp.]
MTRAAEIKRDTKETQIALKLELEGDGKGTIDTGCGFLNHMLELFTRHGNFHLDVKCVGDVDVDYHHTTEDIGIALGEAFMEALGERRGIYRYADITLPMDEVLMLCAVDISGRSYLGFDVEMPQAKVGDFDTELVKDFFLGFVRKADVTLHFKEFAGENTHHVIEAMFKAFGRVMDHATAIDPQHEGEIPSTKGIL